MMQKYLKAPVDTAWSAFRARNHPRHAFKAPQNEKELLGMALARGRLIEIIRGQMSQIPRSGAHYAAVWMACSNT